MAKPRRMNYVYQWLTTDDNTDKRAITRRTESLSLGWMKKKKKPEEFFAFNLTRRRGKVAKRERIDKDKKKAFNSIGLK